MSTLAHEVVKFREWAASHGLGVRCSGEWECDYPRWQSLCAATHAFLAAAAQHTLTQAELELLLYVLARDNEDEHILETLERFPRIAAQVIESAANCSDVDARWQAAVLAERIGSASLVRRFLDDEAEYVRRRAAFALQELESGTQDKTWAGNNKKN